MHKWLFLTAICTFCSLFGQQDSTVVLDSSHIVKKEITESFLEKYRNDKAFNYEVVEQNPTWWDDFKTWLGNVMLRIFEAIFGMERASGILSIFLEIIPYILLGLLIFILIKFILRLNAHTINTKGKQGDVLLSEEERIIKTEDIGELIEKALAEKNFRLAVRYYYLQSLKQLNEREFIDWQLQKTNSDYVSEITKEDLKQQFAHITKLYDYIWYGDFFIDEQRFLRAEPSFKNLEKMILGYG
ncbi:DUF4129 domain-containing protein [Cytophaga sp. FL35]|uniref:DUF4129 domain-containing protein n=1 Tax=Cytophaga sp. FL35 TaxID=1904456 RepID=UPI001653D830|nr:DUF4129 domain-containing protein [Cytophaga sp. FL35]MBC6999973.1 DUF4129 domain-containing protein [Cytophaga sp. FL35]